MAKLVTVKLGEGNWEQGFPVILQIAEEGSPPSIEVTGKLPSAPEIPQNYDQWQSSYRHLPVVVRLTAPATQITNVSTTADCRQTLQTLQDSLKRWLNSESFRPVRERLLENLNRSEPIRFIIQAGDGYLRRLPWNLIEFFDHYPKLEVAIAASFFEKIVSPPSPTKRLRILAILGNSEGIDVTADRRFLENLPGAETVFLVEPPRREISEQLWEQHWDILFFAGHSHTEGEVGRIYINQRESLTIGELKHGLRTAIEGGLQLAIFNSCDFLKAFSRGKSLYLSVRMARERLAEEGLDAELPGVMGLPVICQNPAATPLVWTRKKKLSILYQGKLVIGALALGAVLLLIPKIITITSPYRVYDPNKEQLNGDLKISYPKNWKIKYPPNWQKIPSATNTEVVKFLAPKDHSSVFFQPSVIVSIEQIENPAPLDKYTDDTVKQISRDFSQGFPITPERTKLGKLDATEILYTKQQGDKQIKIKQVWALAPNHAYAYIVTYQAEPARFAEFEKTAQKIIDSFTIN